MRRWLVAFAAALAAILTVPASAAAGPFSNWAAVVVSGDFHAAHTNNPTETFDNARRDVAAELIRKGFSAANVRQFSVRPLGSSGEFAITALKASTIASYLEDSLPFAMASGSTFIRENSIIARPSAPMVHPSSTARPRKPQRRLHRSLTMPPSARANRFISPNMLATRPAIWSER